MAIREVEYETYVRVSKGRGFQPVDFRCWLETMDEYEREWEIATYEYEHMPVEILPETLRSV